MSDTAIVFAVFGAMFTIIGASVGPAWVVANVIGKRLDDVVARLTTVEAKIDGIAETLVRQDVCLRRVEQSH